MNLSLVIIMISLKFNYVLNFGISWISSYLYPMFDLDEKGEMENREEMHDYLILTNITTLYIQENLVKFSQLIEVFSILLIIGVNTAFYIH